jgi:alpha-ketoglutarate-dependent taurine dioxygenase
VFFNLEQQDFVVLPELDTYLSTVEVARRLGTIVEIDRLLPSSGIPNVQSLRPRNATEAKQNQYSGNYGHGLFPLHTDLAHWVLPPRYLLLRCLVGAEDVFTNLLPSKYALDLVGKAALQKAVFRGRRREYGCSGLVRAISYHHQEEIFRWDPIFLQPLNRNARRLKIVMHDPACNRSLMTVRLTKPGDTIIIDNWRMLHGRSSVSARSTGRHIERVYLSEVFNDS